MEIIRIAAFLLAINGYLCQPAAKQDCRSIDCEPEKELKFKEIGSQNDENMNSKKESIIHADLRKKDCKSPMCWFWVGKREVQKFSEDLFEQERTQKKDTSCSSPMCWFRAGGKRQELKRKSARLFNTKTFSEKILEAAKRNLKINKENRDSQKRCSSPMCWFRVGREVIKGKRLFAYKPGSKPQMKIRTIAGSKLSMKDDKKSIISTDAFGKAEKKRRLFYTEALNQREFPKKENENLQSAFESYMASRLREIMS